MQALSTTMLLLGIWTIASWCSLNAQEFEDPEKLSTPTTGPQAEEEEILIIGKKAQTLPGSSYTVHEDVLKEWKERDVARVLDQVPGVNIQEEEGFGLRPNIGMRGATPHRSRKITLMEDGVLAAPAPYSAPAAYYFPSLSRMRKLEVLKGPLAIKAGPNTIGGGLNFVTKNIPRRAEGSADLSYGSYGFHRLGLSYGEQLEAFGYIVSGERIGTDGFQTLPNNGATGFRKNDLMTKLQWHVNSTHTLSLKLSFGSELSQASYLGLTPSDFAANPYQRYAASQRDEMNWQQVGVHVSDQIRLAESTNLRIDVYRNHFNRSWNRFNGFQDSNINMNRLLNASSPSQEGLIRILRGQEDTSSPQGLDRIILVDNDRTYLSQGAQAQIQATFNGSIASHHIDAGLRFHQDSVDRHHSSQRYQMIASALSRDDSPVETLTDNLDRSQAVAIYFQDSISFNSWTVTPGIRTELIANQRENNLGPGESIKNSSQNFMPGIGSYFSVTDQFGFLAGAYRGITPVSPGQDKSIRPEESDNFEFGYRYNASGFRNELIGFYNDYRNITGTCTFAGGCANNQLDQEFNGGRAKIVGAEFLTSASPHIGKVRLPVQVNYTFTDARFAANTQSANPEWGEGDIQVNDPLPYVATHNLSTSLGVELTRWRVNTSLRYLGERFDQSVRQDRRTLPAYTLVDCVGHVALNSTFTTYLKVENLFNRTYLSSLRPFGDRPGMPRVVSAGIEASF